MDIHNIETTRWVYFDIKFTRQGFGSYREPGILFTSLPIVSLFKLAIMT